MLVFMPVDITFDDILKSMAHIRYWQSCANDRDSLANPMQIDQMQEEGEGIGE